jgi:hypothetical protein
MSASITISPVVSSWASKIRQSMGPENLDFEYNVGHSFVSRLVSWPWSARLFIREIDAERFVKRQHLPSNGLSAATPTSYLEYTHTWIARGRGSDAVDFNNSNESIVLKL